MLTLDCMLTENIIMIHMSVQEILMERKVNAESRKCTRSDGKRQTGQK